MKLNKKKFKDRELIGAIKAAGPYKERLVSKLYDANIDFVARGQKQFRIPRETAKDHYAESVIELVRKIEKGKFPAGEKISTVLFQEFSEKCARSGHVKAKAPAKVTRSPEWIYHQATDMPKVAQNLLKDIVSNDPEARVATPFKRLEEWQRQLLWDLDFHKYSLKEVARRMGTRNTRSIQNRQFKSLDKLKDLIRKSEA